jgi:hypothetical protein
MCTLVHMRSFAAPVQNLVKCKTLGLLRQCESKCKNVVVGLRQIISAKAYVCQVQKLIFDQSVQVLYNYYINRRQLLMTTADFFADFAYEHYSEFVDAELREMFQCTNPQDENFDLDVPF